MTTLWQDVRYGVRMLGKAPGFTAIALITLAIGIGANTAIFSLMYALLLRSLPVPHPEELRFLCQRTPEGQKKGFSYAACRMLEEQSRSFTAMGMVGVPGPFLVSTPGGNLETLRREYAGAGYFAALGLHPAAGRFFTFEEDTTPSTSVVISYRYWKRKFNLSPEAIGSTLYAGVGKPYTIIGVMAPEYGGITPEYAIDVWLQESDGRTGMTNDHSAQGWYQPLARLKSGVFQKQALAELDTIFQRYLQEHAGSFPEGERSQLSGRHVLLTTGATGNSGLGRQLHRPLTVLMVLVALVLLLACANIGNMLLARTAARSREIAIRIAVGAGRGHLVRQLLTESLVLALIGGALGLALACWGAKVLVTLAPGYVLNIDVSPDLRVLAFTVVVSLSAGLLFGFVPALHAARSDVAPVLKGSNTVLKLGRYHLSKLLVVSQVALAIVLLAGAGLFIGTLARLKTQDVGFAREHVVFAEVVTPMGYRPEADPAIRRLLDKLRQMSGVLGVGIGVVPSDTPLYTVEVDGRQPPAGEKLESQLREVSDGFFETLRTPLLQGRLLEHRDCGPSPNQVAVVNESFVRRFFGGESPLGRRVSAAFGGHKVGPLEIIGVVADARYTNPKVEPLPEIVAPTGAFWGARLLIRTAGDPRTLMAALPKYVQQEEPGLQVLEMDTLTHATDRALTQERMLAGLSGFFGLIALILASIGIFGVVSHATAQRTREIGIRMALGAQRVSVLWMVLRETLALLLVGLAIGIPVLLLGGRLVASLLYGLKPADPVTLIAAVLALSGVGLLAGYLPARRAAKIDPMAALRCE